MSNIHQLNQQSTNSSGYTMKRSEIVNVAPLEKNQIFGTPNNGQTVGTAVSDELMEHFNEINKILQRQHKSLVEDPAELIVQSYTEYKFITALRTNEEIAEVKKCEQLNKKFGKIFPWLK